MVFQLQALYLNTKLLYLYVKRMFPKVLKKKPIEIFMFENDEHTGHSSD